MKFVKILFGLSLILMFSCTATVQTPQEQLLEAFEKTEANNSSDKLIFLYKTAVLCDRIDCDQIELPFGKKHIKLCTKEDLFMYRSPHYYMVQKWNEEPELNFIKIKR